MGRGTIARRRRPSLLSGRSLGFGQTLPSYLVVSGQDLSGLAAADACQANPRSSTTDACWWCDARHIAVRTAAASGRIVPGLRVAKHIRADLLAGVVVVEEIVAGVYCQDFVGSAGIGRRVVGARVPVRRRVALGDSGPVAVRASVFAN